MSHHFSRAIGYQPWGVTNPWVFADLSQPQRLRGKSNYVFQTTPPHPHSSYLGQAEAAPSAEEIMLEQNDRARRMEAFTIASLCLSVASLAMFRGMMMRNARRNGRRRSKRRSTRRSRR